MSMSVPMPPCSAAAMTSPAAAASATAVPTESNTMRPPGARAARPAMRSPRAVHPGRHGPAGQVGELTDSQGVIRGVGHQSGAVEDTVTQLPLPRRIRAHGQDQRVRRDGGSRQQRLPRGRRGEDDPGTVRRFGR